MSGLNDAQLKVVREAAAAAARAEIRTNRYRRWLSEAVLTIAVVIGLLIIQDNSTEDTEDVARALAAQNTVLRYEQDRTTVLSQRQGCGAVNEGLRTPLFEFLLSAIQRAQGQARLDPVASEVNLQAAREYRGQSEMMVEAVERFAQTANRPEANCQRLYPLPKKPDRTIFKLARDAPAP